MNEIVEILSDLKLGFGIGKLVSSLLFGSDSDYRMDALNDGFKSIQSNKYEDAIRLFSRIKENDPLWMRTISSYGLSLACALQGNLEYAYHEIHQIINITESKDNPMMFFAPKKGTIKEWRVYCEELENVICGELSKQNPQYVQHCQKSELRSEIFGYAIFVIIMVLMILGIFGVFS